MDEENLKGAFFWGRLEAWAWGVELDGPGCDRVQGGPQSQLLVPKRGVRIKEAVLKDIVG